MVRGRVPHGLGEAARRRPDGEVPIRELPAGPAVCGGVISAAAADGGQSRNLSSSEGLPRNGLWPGVYLRGRFALEIRPWLRWNPLESVSEQVPLPHLHLCRIFLEETFILEAESLGRTVRLLFSNHLELILAQPTGHETQTVWSGKGGPQRFLSSTGPPRPPRPNGEAPRRDSSKARPSRSTSRKGKHRWQGKKLRVREEISDTGNNALKDQRRATTRGDRRDCRAGDQRFSEEIAAGRRDTNLSSHPDFYYQTFKAPASRSSTREPGRPTLWGLSVHPGASPGGPL